MSSWIDIFPLIILTLHLLDKWFLSKGQLYKVYCLTLVGSLCAATFNILLVMTMNGAHFAILSFCISSAWSMIMATRGLRRLHKEKRDGKDRTTV